VLVHCRDAHEETLAILAEVPVSETGGIMHCFSGDTAVAKRCLDLGLLISLAGPVTYPKARALPEVAKLVPADRLVVETDCPFLPPQPHRGQRNEPAYLTITAARVAELRGEPLAGLAARMSENARTLPPLPRRPPRSRRGSACGSSSRRPRSSTTSAPARTCATWACPESSGR